MKSQLKIRKSRNVFTNENQDLINVFNFLVSTWIFTTFYESENKQIDTCFIKSHYIIVDQAKVKIIMPFILTNNLFCLLMWDVGSPTIRRTLQLLS